MFEWVVPPLTFFGSAQESDRVRDSSGVGFPVKRVTVANPQFCPFWCKCRRWVLRKTKILVSRKPRRLHTFTDSRAEPIFQRMGSRLLERGGARALERG